MPEAYRRLIDALAGASRPKAVECAGRHWTFSYRRRWLHDPQNPLREALDLASVCEVETAEQVVVFGFGAGYPVEAVLARASPAARICCVVIDPGAFEVALSFRDLTHVLGDRRLTLALGALREIVAAMPIADAATRIVYHRPLGLAASPEYASLVDMAEELLGRQMSFAAQKEGIRANILANLPTISSCERACDLFPALDGEKVLLVAPGPSLREQLPLLREKPRPITIALDTSVKALLRAGITADAIVTLDSTPGNVAKLEGVALEQPLIFFEGARPEFVARAERPVFACERGGLLDGCDPFFGSGGRFESCGSVLHAALDIVLAGGVQQVALVGADLALGKQEAGGETSAAPVAPAATKTVEGRDGRPLATSESLWRHHRRVVRRLRREVPGRVLDARAFGANIPGVEQVSLGAWLEQIEARDPPREWPRRRPVSALDGHAASVLDKARRMLTDEQERNS